MKKNTTKVLSIILNLALVGTSFADVGMPGVAANAETPDFAKALVPPSQLGFLDSYYKGQTDKPVILIQDLHGNYGVKKKIQGILNHLQPVIAQGDRPVVIGIEAAWGDIDLTSIRKKDERVRQVAGEFLMKENEITGVDMFAMMSKTPVKMVGIDNPDDYILNRDIVRKSVVVRFELAQKVERLRAAVAANRVDAPHALKQLWRIDDAFHAGKMDLTGLAKALGVPSIENYGQAEALLAQRKEDLADQQAPAHGVLMSNLVRADEDLQLLSRLLRQQLTLEEVQFVSGKTQEMLTVIQSLLPGENMDVWKNAIESAVDYYAVALMRDKPLSENARELVEKNPDTNVVIVTGGFHTAGMTEYFKQRGISYVVIAPAVDSQTDYDEMLYIKRVMGIHLTEADMIQKGLAKMAQRSAQAMDSISAMVASLKPDVNRADVNAGATMLAAEDVAEKVVEGGAQSPTDLVTAAAGIVTPETVAERRLAEQVEESIPQGAPTPEMPSPVLAGVEAAEARLEHAVGINDVKPLEPQSQEQTGFFGGIIGGAKEHLSNAQAAAQEHLQKVADALKDKDLGQAAVEGEKCSFCAWTGNAKYTDARNFVASVVAPFAEAVDNVSGKANAKAYRTAEQSLIALVDANVPGADEATQEEMRIHGEKLSNMLNEAADQSNDPTIQKLTRAASARIQAIAEGAPHGTAAAFHPVAPIPEPISAAALAGELAQGVNVERVATEHQGPNLFQKMTADVQGLIPGRSQAEKDRQTHLADAIARIRQTGA